MFCWFISLLSLNMHLSLCMSYKLVVRFLNWMQVLFFGFLFLFSLSSHYCIFVLTSIRKCLVTASLIAQLVKNLPAMQETPVWFLSWDDLLEKGWIPTPVFLDFPSGSDGKESACRAGDLGSIPRLGRFPGGGHGNPLQYSCLENPHGQRSLQTTYSPWGRKELDTTERLSTAQSEKCGLSVQRKGTWVSWTAY